ncbi:MAG: sugar phosphate isomerase/epimerase family protein [Aristaeellaceae bacterium]
MIQFGLCGGLEKLHDAKAAGFAYLEPPVSGVAALSAEDFASALAEVRGAGMPTPAFNLLFPRTLQLLDPAVTDAEIAAYLEPAMARVEALGGRVAVFGSGRSRNRPEDVPYDAAFRRLIEVTRLTGEIAGRHGVTIVIEPLNRAESNMINSVAEGACLAAAVNHPSVQVLADYYHMALEGEPIGDIVRVGGITHAHIATKEGRRYPTVMEEGFGQFFRALKATGYDGLVSVEGKTDDMAADGPVSLRLLAQLLAEA